MNNTKYVILILVYFFSFYSGYAQLKSKETVPLITFLEQIKETHGVSFSYADLNVSQKTIKVPEKTLTLAELLEYIEVETGLSIAQIDGLHYAIRTINTPETSFQFLEEVVVTNYLTKGISLKNGGITKITPQKFGILPGLIEPDVLQTIQALPGIQSVDERVSNLNIRGGTHDQNLILWDGIKMYQSGHFFGLISAFNPYLTQDVIVSKNGTSVRYGDGVSSIIDMKSSNTLSHEFSGGAGFNLISADAYAKIPLNKRMELQLSIRRSTTDLMDTPTYDQYSKRVFQDTDLVNNSNSFSTNERFYFYDASLKFLYDINETDKIRVSALNLYNKLNYEENATINNIDQTLNSALTQTNLAVGIEYSRQWNSKLNTSAQIYLSNYDLFARNSDVLNTQRLLQENEILDNGLKFNVNYLLEQNLNYTGGYQYTEVGISNLEDVNAPAFRRFIKEVLRTHAIYNEIQFTSNSKNTAARIGIRTNYIEKLSEFFMEPRLHFSQKLSKALRLELIGELKSQTTSQIIDLQNDFLGVEKRRWTLSNNSDVPIIDSKQASLGLHFNRDNWTVSAEAYIKMVEGITTRSQGFQNQYQFIDAIGNYEVKGMDVLVNKRFPNFSTWLSYTYSKNNYTFENLNFGRKFPNNLDIRHALTFAGTYTIRDFKLALGVNWRSGKPYTTPDPNTPLSSTSFINYDAPNSETLSDYLRMDLSATYNFKLTSGTDAVIGVSIWNLLDTQNTINRYYVIDENDTISRVDNESLGITPNMTFRMKF